MSCAHRRLLSPPILARPTLTDLRTTTEGFLFCGGGGGQLRRSEEALKKAAWRGTEDVLLCYGLGWLGGVRVRSFAPRLGRESQRHPPSLFLPHLLRPPDPDPLRRARCHSIFWIDSTSPESGFKSNLQTQTQSEHVASGYYLLSKDGEVIFEEELSYSYSYFQVRNLGTFVTSVTVPTIKICLKK